MRKASHASYGSQPRLDTVGTVPFSWPVAAALRAPTVKSIVVLRGIVLVDLCDLTRCHGFLGWVSFSIRGKLP
ncbi:uncharacterized protein UV8b_08113 [Ustilaginoidea virens]|uniref:Uncharacterized protein n=1 Tax=Ustilaginoidea virens TaxID=1159556 RepID=A0A8E5MLL7_USTVR|nr:uncharacterized protein UV8b_08113 [Ustilaginoidea virens]QUC23872.1 hypothetical protein UV8b_08113 [Ustilaginoidea virens]